MSATGIAGAVCCSSASIAANARPASNPEAVGPPVGTPAGGLRTAAVDGNGAAVDGRGMPATVGLGILVTVVGGGIVDTEGAGIPETDGAGILPTEGAGDRGAAEGGGILETCRDGD